MECNRQVLKDIEETKFLLSKKRETSGFKKYSSFFLFGTENQEGINKILDYKDKQVLTVASSGDQYLGAIYYNAKNVDIFDINKLTYYLTYLKIVSIICLSYEEFLNFFVPVHSETIVSSFWDLRTLKKLLPYLPSDVAYFWDSIMFEIKNNNIDFITPSYISNHLNIVKSGMPFYAIKEEYYKLQSKLKNREFPKFIEADLLELWQVLDNQYDIIYLSNIIECLVYEKCKKYYRAGINRSVENRVEKEYLKKVVSGIVNKLNNNGIMMMSYRSNSNLKFSTDHLYNNDYFDVTSVFAKVVSYDETGFEEPDTDLVLTYKPSENKKLF